MQIVTIDFETFYSRTYSLSKMTTEEYVRGDEFQVVGVAVQVGDAEPEWFSGSDEETLQFLQKFEFEKNLALAHHAMFDAAILTWHYGIKPKGWLDTLSMGRALHGTEVGGSLKVLAEHYQLGVKGTEVENALGFRREDFSPEHLARYGEYCRNDVALTYKLFSAMSHQLPSAELKLIDLTIKMFSEPVLQLDADKLKHHLGQVKAVKQQTLGMYDRDTLMSNPKFADVLRQFGVEPPMKISPVTGRETYAFSKTDEAFKALLDYPIPQVGALVSARLGAKSTLEETRTERFLGISQRGPLPVPLRYYAAHTGRWGGDDKLNLQNLPRISTLKHAIIPPEGYVILDSDSSQIEARTVAWLAEQDDLVAAFDAGQDVYKIMASAIYGKSVGDVTKDERFVGKTTILGAGYGMGPVRFRDQLKTFGVTISEDESRHIIRTYRETYPKIPEFWRTAGIALEAIMNNQSFAFGRNGVLLADGKDGVKLPNGLHIKYPNLRYKQTDGKTEMVYNTKRGRAIIDTRIYGGKVTENVCQALARIVIGYQMLFVAKKYKVVMTVHDAIACVAPKDEADRALEYVEMCMKLRPEWASDLPLNCEAGYGKSYGDC